MLKKTNFDEPASVATPAHRDNQSAKSGTADIARVRPKNVSVFGSTLVFKGQLSADEEILIQGTIEGTIAHQNKNVTVGKLGRVSALIHAASVTIEGRVDGDIHGDDFVLLAETAEVNGNIYCPRIRMDDGAIFNGTIQMGQKPILSAADQT